MTPAILLLVIAAPPTPIQASAPIPDWGPAGVRTTPAEHPVVEYDEFKQMSMMHAGVSFDVWMNQVVRMDWFTISLVAIWEGRTPKTPPAIYIDFFSGSEDWVFLKFHDIAILADSTPIRVEKIKRDGDVGHGHVTERVYGTIALSDLERMAKAESVRFRLGSFQVRADDRGREIIHEVFDKLTKSAKVNAGPGRQ